MAQQVQQITQQLVGLANTSVNGSYIFGGDDSTTQPYTYNWTTTGPATQNSTAGSTAVLRDAAGDEIVPNMTAQQVFDVRDSSGNPTTGNILQAAYTLGTALQTAASTGDTSGIAPAIQQVKAAVSYLGQVTATYGNTEDWINTANTDAANRLVNLQQSLSNVKDANIATVATQLSSDQMSLQAALQAHASTQDKSLFSYLG